MEKMMGRASIYRFKKTGKIFIHSESQLQMGVGVASEPYIWLDVNTSHEEVINALIVAMSQSKKGLPNPKDWASFTKDFINAIGLKKESDLYKGSINVGVMHKDGIVSFPSSQSVQIKKKFYASSPEVRGDVACSTARVLA
jgi:hypothetical protein